MQFQIPGCHWFCLLQTGNGNHSFSKKPLRFYIDPKPGGGFYEIFNERGDGVLHATVIFAERGKKLRFDGPLGLAGKAIHMVHTIDFKAIDAHATKITCSVRAAGEMQTGISDIVKSVWHHFLVERFKPFVEKTETAKK